MNKLVMIVFFLFFLSPFVISDSGYYGVDFYKASPLEILPFVDRVKKDAAAGNSDAQLRLSIIYSRGIGVDMDPDESRLWLIKSANQDNQEANYFLGQMHLLGTREKKDIGEALKRFQISAKNGNHKSEHLAGVIYFGMYGSSYIDIKKSEKYLKKSSLSGNGFSSLLLSCIYKYDLNDASLFSHYLHLSALQKDRRGIEHLKNNDDQYFQKKCKSFRL